MIAHRLAKLTGMSFASGTYVHYGHRKRPCFIPMLHIMLLPTLHVRQAKDLQFFTL